MDIKTLAVNSFSKAYSLARKHSPEILLGVGIAGGVASGVVACRATLKVHKIRVEYYEMVEDIETGFNEFSREEYTEEDFKNDLFIAKVQTAVKYVQLYIPAAMLATGSITLILFGHRIMAKRLVGVMAAYQVLDTAFKNYRQRVVEDLGEDVDNMYRFGITSELKTKITTTKSGKEKKTEVKEIGVPDANDPKFKNVSMYARFFDESSTQWRKNHDGNLFFLKAQEQYANDRLNIEGFVLLNEVLENLGIPRTREGCVVGWVKKGEGDGYISFGIYNPENADFINDYQADRILLDFNVDGIVYDKI